MTRTEIIGDARLILGDCLEVLPTLDGIDCVVTSPPYNQMTGLMRKPTGLWADKSGGLGFVNSWQENGYDDDLPEHEYQSRQNYLFETVRRACRPCASLFYNHQLRWRDGVLLHPVQWFKPDGWRMRQEIIWDRGGGMMFNARMFCRFDERVLWFTNGDCWKWNQSEVGHGTIWKIAREQNKEHPVAFPYELAARPIRAATDESDTVFDPFMGSGTTGVACAKLGRKFIGIELELKYFDIACKRIDDAYKQPRLFAEPAPKPKQEALGL